MNEERIMNEEKIKRLETTISFIEAEISRLNYLSKNGIESMSDLYARYVYEKILILLKGEKDEEN